MWTMIEEGEDKMHDARYRMQVKDASLTLYP